MKENLIRTEGIFTSEKSEISDPSRKISDPSRKFPTQVGRFPTQVGKIFRPSVRLPNFDISHSNFKIFSVFFQNGLYVPHLYSSMTLCVCAFVCKSVCALNQPRNVVETLGFFSTCNSTFEPLMQMGINMGLICDFNAILPKKMY
jgi:hypothetical protein